MIRTLGGALFALCLVTAACGSSGGGRPSTGTTGPVPPTVDAPSLSVAEVEDLLLTATLHLSWEPASNGTSRSTSLLYRAYWSLVDDVRTVDEARRNGTPASDWTADVTELFLAGLEPDETYFVNVVVQNDDGLQSAYQSASITLAKRVAIRVRNLTSAAGDVRFVAYGAGFPPSASIDPQAFYDFPLPPDGSREVRGEFEPLRLTATVGVAPALPALRVDVGNRYGPNAAASALEWLGAAAVAGELEVANTATTSIMDATVLVLGRPYVRVLNLLPGMQAALPGFAESWLVGASTSLDGGPPPASSLSTQVSLLGIASADLLISLAPNQDFVFSLLNVTLLSTAGSAPDGAAFTATATGGGLAQVWAGVRGGRETGETVTLRAVPPGVRTAREGALLVLSCETGTFDDVDVRAVLENLRHRPSPERQVLGIRELFVSGRPDGEAAIASARVLVVE